MKDKFGHPNHPLEECVKGANKFVAGGCQVYQKWTCAKCGDRVTAYNPNTFSEQCHHEDCGHITDIRLSGCNYMVVASGNAAIETVHKLMDE